MTKKIVLLVSALFAFSLVGCTTPSNGGSSAASSSSPTTSTPTTSAPTTSAPTTSDPASSSSTAPTIDLTEFLSKFAVSNYTVEFEDFVSFSFFGKDALYGTYLGDYADYGSAGSINVGTQGMFDFTMDDKAITLGNCDTVSPDATISWFYYTLEDLATSAKTWTAGTVANVYTSTDTVVGSAIACLGGYKDYANSSKSTFSTQLIIGDSADAAILKTTMTYNKKAYDIEAEVTKIGTTENAVVSAFLAAPPTLTAATAWSSQLQSSMTTLVNEVIPLPTGTSYATYESVSADDDGAVTGITYQDFGSGDILAAYQAQLIADGWSLSSERTDEEGDMENYGYVMYMYEKVKTEATAKEGKVVYTLQVSYEPVDAFDSASAKEVYPQGIFQIIASVYQYPLVITTDVAGLNTYYADLTKADGTMAIPTIAFASTVTGITITDYTLTASAIYGIEFANYSDAAIAIATEADALADIATIGAGFVSAGYTDYGPTIADDGYLQYLLADAAYPNLDMNISLTPNYTDDGAYAGTITIEVMAG